MKKECWKPLIYKEIDLSDRFRVSNYGEIYSLKSKKILKQRLNLSTGYYGVCVSLGGRDKKMLIKPHIAVACSFVGGYKDGLVVNHKDGNKTNNFAENLEWVTKSENTFHAYHNDLIKNHRKIKCVNTGEVFNSVADACRWCGLSIWSRSIKELLDGNENRKTAGRHPVTKEKLTWELI